MLRLAVICVMVVSAWAAEECFDMGVSGGTLCDGRYCPKEESKCVDNKCECVTDRGQPGLLCSNDVDFFASCTNDPNAWTMNDREAAQLPVPCMYQFSHVMVRPRTKFSPKGKCHVQVNLQNQRVRGKMFVGGFEVGVSCRRMNSMVGNQDNVYKADAYVNDEGKYCFNLQVSNDGGKTFHDDLQSASSKVDLAPYTFQVDKTTNRVKLQVPVLGVTAQLRPFDPQFTVFNQKWLAGFAVKYDADKKPKFRSDDTVVSLKPGVTLEEVSEPYFTPSDELTFRAFTGPGNKKRDFPNYTNKCPAVKQTLNDCPNEQVTSQAMDKCGFVLDKPNFVNCYSVPNSGEVVRVLTLYNKCVEAFCQEDATMCNSVKLELGNLDDSCKMHAPNDVLNDPCVF